MLKNNNAVPLYHQLADIIREQIFMQEYKQGDRLPSERQFAKEYNISVIT